MSHAPVRYEQEIPTVLQALAAVHATLDGVDRTLAHLVKLRASQINGCAHCVQMHTREAREDGETDDRLHRLIVWSHVGDFTAREKAALAWTEALTVLDPKTDYASLRARLREHLTDAQIGALTATVGMINLWNRIAISRH